MSAFTLKILAAAAMLIDHLGAILFPEYLWMRCVGRLAFPLYAFLLTEGFLHTRDVDAYIRRLAVFALISEPFFDRAFYGTWVWMGHQNIFFTLALSLLLLKLLESSEKTIWRGIWAMLITIAAEVIGCDYGAGGVLTVLIFYEYRQNKKMMALLFAAAHIFLWGTFSIQSFAVLALFPIFLYNGKEGRKIKYAFYIFYPLHLFILGVI